MIFDPGILDLAHSKGIKYLDDLNHDGRIDQADLNIALSAKKAAAQANGK